MPLVEVAHHHARALAGGVADEGREQVELRAPLTECEAEVAIEDMQRGVGDGEIHAQRAARLAEAAAEVAAGGGQDAQPREDGVAVRAAAVRARLAHHHRHAEPLRQVRRLVGVGAPVGPNHLLQTDDVGIRLRDHGGDAVEIAASIETDAAVDVVADDGDRRHAAVWPPAWYAMK
jgi:hypothetical protein